MKWRRLQAGTTLIEILAAVVIFAVCLVGMAALSLTALRSTADGHYVSQATLLADELADAMRSNLAGYEGGNFATTPGASGANCAPGSTCTALEQVQFDASRWMARVGNVLPAGTALICMDSTPDDGQPGEPACDGNGLNTLKIFWLDNSAEESLDAGESFHRHVVALVP